MSTTVVHCRKTKYDIYIGRPSKWSNPFKIGLDGSRYEVLQKYERWVVDQPELMAALGEIRNKILGCWCKPDKPCHGDVLAKLADGAAERGKQRASVVGRVPPSLFDD